MFIYEFFRKTFESYICIQIEKKYSKNFFINVNINYLKHMIEQVIFNSWIKININSIGDINIDYHHITEDIGITLGKIFKYFIPFNKKLFLNRYGFSYVPLDDSLSRTVIDLSGRSYLNYNVFYYNLYIKNFNINLFYDFFFSFSNNSNITLYIDNITGYNIHHIFETIFKSFGLSLRNCFTINDDIINSSKKIIY